jgi:hypothetical protein
MVVVGAATVFAAGCASDGADGSGDAVIAVGGGSNPFCDVYSGLPTDVSETYVGSAQHIADVDALLVVAPTGPVRTDLSTYRQFLASGAVTSEPSTKDRENWPPAVISATDDIQAYGTTVC